MTENVLDMTRISQIELDDSGLPPPTPEIEQERKVAMFDLLESNSFSLPALRAPFALTAAASHGSA